MSRTFRAVDPVVYELATETTAATFQINNAKFMFQLSLFLLMIISNF